MKIYVYILLFSVLGKKHTKKFKHILSKCCFPYEFLDWNPTNSFLSYTQQFPYEGKTRFWLVGYRAFSGWTRSSLFLNRYYSLYGMLYGKMFSFKKLSDYFSPQQNNLFTKSPLQQAVIKWQALAHFFYFESIRLTAYICWDDLSHTKELLEP